MPTGWGKLAGQQVVVLCPDIGVEGPHDAFAQLITEFSEEPRMGVTDVAHSDTGEEVNVPVAVTVPHFGVSRVIHDDACQVGHRLRPGQAMTFLHVDDLLRG